MEPVIGIDLGTTNSCVAVVLDGVPEVIPNKGGYKTTPSVVAITVEGKRLVGHIAKRQMFTNPENTVFAAKRLIGRKWTTAPVQHALTNVSYKIVQGPHEDVRVELRGKVYSLPETSAMVLAEMRRVAEDYLGQEVRRAVITVPAYFNDGQRQATKDAGRIAGLDVLRIINEPTAAALAYGYGKDYDRRVAIYDLGGGTFDVSILQISGGVFEVIATGGDTYLGGEDFDNRIVDWLAFNFAKEHQVDLRRDKLSLQRLKDAAEKAKIQLSGTNDAEINLPFIYSSGGQEAFHLQTVLNRAKFEELVADLIERTFHICDKVLKEAYLQVTEITDVILVGGQTRTPKVQEGVQRFFGREPSKGVHPDEVVAVGASIQGAALVADKQETLLLDVTPHALGIMIVGGYFEVLIEKNSTVPTSVSRVFTTVRENQTSVRIMVLQGESDRAEENELLGEFILTGLRKAARGEVEVEVTFEISADGILSVAARDVETGKEQSIIIKSTSGLTEDEVRDMVRTSEDYMLGQRSAEEYEHHRQRTERLVADVEKMYPQVREILSEAQFGMDALRKADAVLGRAKSAMQNKDMAALGDTLEPLERTLHMFKGVVQRIR